MFQVVWLIVGVAEVNELRRLSYPWGHLVVLLLEAVRSLTRARLEGFDLAGCRCLCLVGTWGHCAVSVNNALVEAILVRHWLDYGNLPQLPLIDWWDELLLAGILLLVSSILAGGSLRDLVLVHQSILRQKIG